jgi:hypothetical protein
MHRLQNISHAAVLRLALAGLLGSAMAIAQDKDPLTAHDGSLPKSQAAPVTASSYSSYSPSFAPAQSNGGGSHSGTSDEAPARPLILQSEWKRTDAIATYTFTAPTGHLFPGSAYDADAGMYGSSITGGADAYLTNSKATAVHFNADLELDGQFGQMNQGPQGVAQDFMLDWGVSHLFSSDKHPTRALELGVAAYQEWLVSRPLSLGGPFAGYVPGYSLFSAGLETTFTLPEKNAMFSLRYGHEHLVGGQSHGRIFAVGISWTW